MTMAAILLYLAYTVSVLALGFMLGAIATMLYISWRMTKAQREFEKQLKNMPQLPPLPPLPGDEWKQGEKSSDKDENWLRRMLGDDDK